MFIKIYFWLQLQVPKSFWLHRLRLRNTGFFITLYLNSIKKKSWYKKLEKNDENWWNSSQNHKFQCINCSNRWTTDNLLSLANIMRKDNFQNWTQLIQLMTCFVFVLFGAKVELRCNDGTLHKFGDLTSDKRIFGAGLRSNFLSGRLKNWNNNIKKQNEREPEFKNSMA